MKNIKTLLYSILNVTSRSVWHVSVLVVGKITPLFVSSVKSTLVTKKICTYV